MNAKNIKGIIISDGVSKENTDSVGKNMFGSFPVSLYISDQV